MLDPVSIKEITRETDSPILAHHEAINKIMCRNSTPGCYYDECKLHSSTDTLGP